MEEVKRRRQEEEILMVKLREEKRKGKRDGKGLKISDSKYNRLCKCIKEEEYLKEGWGKVDRRS